MRSLADLLYNFHWIVPGKAARSSQAWARMLGPFLTARGIRTMINLRGPNPDWRWWRYEKRVCAARGIAHIDVRLSSKNLPPRDVLVELIQAFDDATSPFVVKCSGGQDRTSLAAALYLLHTQGWAARGAAEAQFARWPYLHLPKPHQRWLRLFLDYAAEEAKGMAIGQWIGGHYSALAFKAWLEARGEGGAFHLVSRGAT